MGMLSMRILPKMAVTIPFSSVVLAALCTTVLLSATIASQPAQARSTTYNLDIPAQSLNDALQAFALASQHKLLYSSGLVDGKRSPALKGQFTTEQAVKALLVGTNLRYEVTSDGLVLIRASDEAPAAPRTSTARAPLAEDSIGENSSAKEGKKNSSGEFRVAQVDQNMVGPQAVSNANSGKKEEGLAEIIVTAQKREERLIDVPISIKALTGDDLTKLNANTSLDDLKFDVPGLSIAATGDSRSIEIRGVSNTSAGTWSNIGMYLDEATVTSASVFQLNLSSYDLERVEVLRGPQGHALWRRILRWNNPLHR
jgi:iron complex outermembrane receptor protein